YYDKAGNAIRVAITGQLSFTFTNLTTGASYSPNSAGPKTVDLLTGQSILRGGDGVMLDSNGVLVAADGRIVTDAAGNIISITGHAVGVCQQIGSTPA